MSLTSQLDDHNSPVSRWVAAHVDRAVMRAIVREVNGDLARAIPLVADRTDPQLVGHSFDFAFRWQIGPLEGTVAQLGAMVASGEGWEEAPEVVAALVAAGSAAGPTERRWRACVVLSWFEMVYRIGSAPPALAECWGQPASAKVRETLLALAPAGPVADVAALMASAGADWDLAREGPFCLNPTFAGSRDVGGADADWIAGATLWECKVSWRQRPFQGKQLLQGLGYVLLDYDDAYRLTALGLYFPRQRQRVSWPLAELLPRLYGTPDLAALRADFRKSVAAVKRVRVPS